MKKRSIFKRILKWTFQLAGLVLLLFIGWSLIPIKQVIKPITARPDTKYWMMQSGYKIAYTLLNGDSANVRPPVIFLHGGPGGYIHSATIQQFKKISALGYDVYLYDQIGSGLSDRLVRPKDYSFNRHLDDLNEIITKHISASKVYLVGHSYGGILASHFAGKNPESISGLILSSPGALQPYRINDDGSMTDMEKLYPVPAKYPFKKPVEVFKETEKQQLQPRIIMSMLCGFAFNFKWANDREFDDYTNMMASKFTKGMVANSSNVKPEEGGAGGYSHGFSNYYVNVPDIRQRVAKLKIPSIVLQGQYDQGSYSDVYEYADLFKGEYVFIPDAGHIIWWDKPNEYNREIADFLNRHEAYATNKVLK